MDKYYKVLGLTPKASKEEVKKAYRALSKKFHPDVNQNDPKAEEKFKEISEAYENITKGKKQKIVNEPDFNFVRKGRDKKLIVELTLEEAYFGGVKPINFMVKDKCQTCDGLGGHNPTTCNQCNGQGFVMAGQGVNVAFPCMNCGGSGVLFSQMCNNCSGQGTVNKKETVNIQIPKGLSKDEVLIEEGVGDYVRGGKKGNVYFFFEIKPHNTYKLEGLNLIRKIKVPILKLMLGGDFNVTTLDGEVKIKIPKLCQIDKKFRLKGKGFNGKMGSGDLMLEVEPLMPKELNKEEESKILELQNSENFKV